MGEIRVDKIRLAGAGAGKTLEILAETREAVQFVFHGNYNYTTSHLRSQIHANMGRELQKKKNRSSLPKLRHKQPSKKKILQNPIIAANW